MPGLTPIWLRPSSVHTPLSTSGRASDYCCLPRNDHLLYMMACEWRFTWNRPRIDLIVHGSEFCFLAYPTRFRHISVYFDRWRIILRDQKSSQKATSSYFKFTWPCGLDGHLPSRTRPSRFSCECWKAGSGLGYIHWFNKFVHWSQKLVARPELVCSWNHLYWGLATILLSNSPFHHWPTQGCQEPTYLYPYCFGC